MLEKKEEFGATRRFEKLYSLLATVDFVETRRDKKAKMFDQIVEILNCDDIPRSNKLGKIKKSILDNYEVENV